MYAVAEVYQSDISKVKVGKQVLVSSDSIPGALLGKVERIDSQVRPSSTLNPSANEDGRLTKQCRF